jgi:hypothetical protein
MQMSVMKMLWIYVGILATVSLPFTAIHIMARPDDAPISPMQHRVAALANFFGPWGVVIVRIVDFPNAGLRSFNLTLAVAMTLVGAGLVALPFAVRKPFVQYSCISVWFAFVTLWFAVRLRQIADGLL